MSRLTVTSARLSFLRGVGDSPPAPRAAPRHRHHPSEPCPSTPHAPRAAHARRAPPSQRSGAAPSRGDANGTAPIPTAREPIRIARDCIDGTIWRTPENYFSTRTRAFGGKATRLPDARSERQLPLRTWVAERVAASPSATPGGYPATRLPGARRHRSRPPSPRSRSRSRPPAPRPSLARRRVLGPTPARGGAVALRSRLEAAPARSWSAGASWGLGWSWTRSGGCAGRGGRPRKWPRPSDRGSVAANEYERTDLQSRGSGADRHPRARGRFLKHRP